jgi:hypothetical protein
MTHWYWALIDDMLCHPELAKIEFAKRFKVSPATIYHVTSSDAFKAAYLERRKELAAKIDETLVKGLTQVARSSLTHLATALDKKRDMIPVKELAEIADKSLNRLGYGTDAKSSSVNVNVNTGQQAIMPVLREDLEAARAALRNAEMQRLTGPVVDLVKD